MQVEESYKEKVSSCAIINDHDSKWNSLYSNQTPISVVNERKDRRLNSLFYSFYMLHSSSYREEIVHVFVHYNL